MRELVWYAAYGSNLSRARFGCYLRGGRPEGSSHSFPGCRDQSDPVDDRAWHIGCELAFGGTSVTWGGGVAFVDPDARAETKARLYLITLEQFEDIVAQENWLPLGGLRLGPDIGTELIVGPEHVYGLVVPVGELDGHPVVTFTQHRRTAVARPSIPYLRHIADGLREAHGMNLDDVARYLSDKRGVASALSIEALISGLG